MATARITKDGDRVKLTLDFEEASALRALLARVGPSTHERINDVTSPIFFALDAVRDDAAWDWHAEFDEFALGHLDLVDPAQPGDED